MSFTRLTIDGLVALLFGTLAAARIGASAELVARLGAGAGSVSQEGARQSSMNSTQGVGMRTVLVGVLAAAAAVAAQAQERGGAIYAQHCLACHGNDGAGMTPGVPDLSAPARVLAKSDRLLLRSLIDGVQKPGAPLGMPPKGGNPTLTDADMRAVLVFLRREFDTHPRQPAGEP